MVGAWRIDRYIDRRGVLGNDLILDKPRLQFLTAFLDHLQALIRIVPNVPILESKVILAQHGTDALTPAAMRF